MTFLYETLGVPFGFLLKLIYQSVGFHNYAISIILLTHFLKAYHDSVNNKPAKGHGQNSAPAAQDPQDTGKICRRPEAHSGGDLRSLPARGL